MKYCIKKMPPMLVMAALVFLEIGLIFGQNVNQPRTVTNDWKLTTAGKVRQLVVNRGRLYKWNTDYPGLIDCEYPPGSREEHITRLLLWMSGITSQGDTLYNGPDDAWPSSAKWDSIWVVNKGDTPNIPYWPDYRAVSDQDFVFHFNDYFITEFGREEPHVPMYIDIIGTVYSWAGPPLDEVLLWQYRIIPTRYDIKGFYLTVTNESKIGNIAVGGGSDDRVTYLSDYNMEIFQDGPGGIDGDAIGAIGFQFFLPKGYLQEQYRPCWLWSSYYFSFIQFLEGDAAIYREIIAPGIIMHDQQTFTGCSSFLSAGPFDVSLGDTLIVSMAEILGRGMDGVLYNANLMKFLYENDFRAPSAPPIPPLQVETRNKAVRLAWEPTADVNPETYQDPYRVDGIRQPFEGYRVYKSTQGPDGPWILLAEYDVPDDGFGQDIGLFYEYTDEGLLNNIEYYYAVTAFSKPDTVLNWPAQESSIFQGMREVVVGPSPPESVGEVAVVPNPYRGDINYNAYNPPWERPPAGRDWLEQDRRVQFINLPEKCEIKVYTLAGEIVARIHHDHPTKGYEDWNLTSFVDQAISPGLYLYTVEDLKTGKVQVGKFVVIK